MAQYKQTEFCLDLSQGNTDSLPTWMKGIRDRLKPLPLKPLSVQLPLFNTSPYASAKNTSPEAKTSRTDRYKQASIPTT
jgi:Tfp pilus assembly protein PilP